MNDREKLLELLHSAKFGVNNLILLDRVTAATIEAVADHLIANCVVIREKGEWNRWRRIIFDSEKTGYRCLACNTTWDEKSNFCPNCGVDMRGEMK